MANINLSDLDKSYSKTPPELVGVYPLGGGGIIEAPYRHFFELQHLKSIVNFTSKMNVLELGSGNGRWIASLAPLVAHYTGVDITHEALDIARKVVACKVIPNVDFHEMSILDFYGDRPYDFIYFSGVSQYLDDDQIHRVLNNLSRWIKSETIIVDRSTVNYRQREILSRTDYYSLFRTPQELEHIFKNHGYCLKTHKRSYRFLRGGRFLRQPIISKYLPILVGACSPLSLYTMFGLTFLLDLIYPIPFEGGDRSHDFHLFISEETPNSGVERADR